jgi:tetratricopeptide (TPR) repeat protein
VAAFYEERPMIRVPAFLLVASLLALSADPARAQFDNVGSFEFPTSASPEAQNHFLRGAAFLHSFGWIQARDEFHAAQEIDQDFAMAYWGESLAYNHPLNSQMDPRLPRETLERLGSTQAERLAKAPTERERGFLSAVEILWGEGDRAERTVAYMEEMSRLYQQYPNDTEVAAFYSLSVLSASTATRDLTQRLNVRAGTISLNLFEHNPDHPGAAHYTIHAFDNPMLAPLSLEAAYRFSEIAPAVAHARHMPTHIFIQHGMWDRVSGNNESAYSAARELWQPGDPMGDAVHPLDWGQYGDLQLGDYQKARLWIERLETMAFEGHFLEGGPRGQPGEARATNTVPLVKARYIVETEEWEVRPITEESSMHELLATGMSAAATGDDATLAQAEAALKAMAERGPNGNSNANIMAKQVGALRHAGMGHAGVATGLMDEAQAIVEAGADPRGAASPVKPVHEMYGEILLGLNQPADAIEKFETSLLRMPNRPRSLLGLARAHAGTGDHAGAADAYSRLNEVWAGRTSFDGYQEARRFLQTTGQP